MQDTRTSTAGYYAFFSFACTYTAGPDESAAAKAARLTEMVAYATAVLSAEPESLTLFNIPEAASAARDAAELIEFANLGEQMVNGGLCNTLDVYWAHLGKVLGPDPVLACIVAEGGPGDEPAGRNARLIAWLAAEKAAISANVAALAAATLETVNEDRDADAAAAAALAITVASEAAAAATMFAERGELLVSGAITCAEF